MDVVNKKIIQSTYLGHFLVSFDAFCFALLIYRVAPDFFPFDDVTAYISGISLFALGMIIKPFGGLCYGYLIQRKGYKFGLIAASIVFCASALGLCLLEPHHIIGSSSYVFLILFRLALGFSSAVEYGSGISLLSDTLQQRKNLAGSLLMTFGTLSSLMAQLSILWLLTMDLVPMTVFKILYGFVFVCGISLASMRFNTLKSINQPQSIPTIKKIFHGTLSVKMLRAVSLSGICISPFYMLMFYWSPLIANSSDSPHALEMNNIAILTTYCLSMPFAGWLCDRYGAYQILFSSIMIFFSLGLFFFSIDFLQSMAAFISLSFVGGGIIAPSAMIVPSHFEGKLKALHTSLFYHLGQGIIGAMTPLVATSIHRATGESHIAWTYLGLLLVVGSLIIKNQVNTLTFKAQST